MTATANLVVLRGFLPLFRIGATVRLKSGGPLMTVTAIHNEHVEVQWFDGVDAHQHIYPVGALLLGRKRRRDANSTCG